ncbi:hypothetical protein [Nocardia miyunensis]|uniref:hypothetical protein n=1 Tax=Nocardia miyunensis TaxID=282684 RepID=UPI000AD9F7C3|nr:hypothetical protein [Nocardia miyunensis]
MSVLAPDAAPAADLRLLPVDRTIARARQRFLRYRMTVVVQDSTEVVRSAGGWLFDRVMAGWDVTVLLADSSNPLPLRILGATVLDLKDVRALEVAGVVPHSVAISAALCESDAHVRNRALDWLERGRQEVTLWGERYSEELDSRTESAQHRLSRAARAFKSCALSAAAGSAESVADTEPFRTGGPTLSWSAGHDSM